MGVSYLCWVDKIPNLFLWRASYFDNATLLRLQQFCISCYCSCLLDAMACPFPGKKFHILWNFRMQVTSFGDCIFPTANITRILMSTLVFSNFSWTCRCFQYVFSLVDITLECPKENNNLRKQFHVHSCHKVGQFISDVF